MLVSGYFNNLCNECNFKNREGNNITYEVPNEICHIIENKFCSFIPNLWRQFSRKEREILLQQRIDKNIKLLLDKYYYEYSEYYIIQYDILNDILSLNDILLLKCININHCYNHIKILISNMNHGKHVLNDTKYILNNIDQRYLLIKRRLYKKLSIYKDIRSCIKWYIISGLVQYNEILSINLMDNQTELINYIKIGFDNLLKH